MACRRDLVLQDGALGCSTSMNCGWWMPSAPGMPSAGDAGDDDGVAPVHTPRAVLPTSHDGVNKAVTDPQQRSGHISAEMLECVRALRLVAAQGRRGPSSTARRQHPASPARVDGAKRHDASADDKRSHRQVQVSDLLSLTAGESVRAARPAHRERPRAAGSTLW